MSGPPNGSVMRYITFSALAHPRRGNMLIGAGALFAIGLTAGILVSSRMQLQLRPLLKSIGVPQHAFVAPAANAVRGFDELAPMNAMLVQRLDPRLVYPVDVLRIIDGDTFVARVRVWHGLYVNTSVRLRDIDAAELRARCAREFAKAQAARTALTMILADGGVTISRIGRDKYGGRIDASVATRRTPDVSAALLRGGYARRYDGGRRGSWCW
jgi:endonuclease YncB( thermonuclease family)